MTNPLTTDGFRNVALLLCRVALGAVFILAGYGKFTTTEKERADGTNRNGVQRFVDKNDGSLPRSIPKDLGRAYLYMLPFAELLVGIAMAIGFYTRTAAMLMLLMLISFTIAVTGVAKGTPPKLEANVTYIALTLLLMATGGGQISVDQSMGGGGPAPGSKKK